MNSQRACSDQRTVFASGEGDAWFSRNRSHLAAYDPAADPLLAAVAAAAIAPRRILDYGCSAGTRLSHWCERFQADGVGIDPGAQAIAEARARDPRRRWECGTIDDHPDVGGGFDLVVCSFVLHWVDRHRLFASLAAIDHHLRPGGCLALIDFLPDFPVRRRYHHRPDVAVFTWKNDYPGMFLASGLYRTLLRQTREYPAGTPAVPGSTVRCQAAVLERIDPSLVHEEMG